MIAWDSQLVSVGEKELYIPGTIALVSTPGPGSLGEEPRNSAAGHRCASTDSCNWGVAREETVAAYNRI